MDTGSQPQRFNVQKSKIEQHFRPRNQMRFSLKRETITTRAKRKLFHVAS